MGRPKTPEGYVLDAVRAGLRILGSRCYLVRQQQGLGSVLGVPDLMGIIDGRGFGIECKAGRGKLTPAQVEHSGRIRAAGGVWCEARSFDDVISAFEAAGIKLPFQPKLRRQTA